MSKEPHRVVSVEANGFVDCGTLCHKEDSGFVVVCC